MLYLPPPVEPSARQRTPRRTCQGLRISSRRSLSGRSWSRAVVGEFLKIELPVFWSRWLTPACLGASSCWRTPSLADCRCSLGMCSVHRSAGETWHGPCWRESPEWCHARQNASPSSWAKTRTWRSAVCETNSGEFDGQDPPLGHVFIGHDDGHPWQGFVEPFESCLHLW